MEPHQQLRGVACRPASATAEPLRSASAAGCPSSSQLQVAWNAAPPSVRRSWPPLTPSGFFAISCWQGWVAAGPVVNANGTVVFSRLDGLRLIPVFGLQPFDSAVCSSPDSPDGWKGPAGPATCNS
jgi:hypothetical protein